MTGKSDDLKQARKLIEEFRHSIEKSNQPAPDTRLFALHEQILQALEVCEMRSAARHERTLAHLELLDRRLLGIERSWPFRIWNTVAGKLLQSYRFAGQLLLRSHLHRASAFPERASVRSADEYLRWIIQREWTIPPSEVRSSAVDGWAYRPLISIIVPIFQSNETWLDAAIRSVEDQCYQRWEICLALDGEPSPSLLSMLEGWAARDSRIRLIRLAERKGISAASNAAAEIAAGEYLGFLDHDDSLAPFALHYMVEALQNSRPGLLYSDQDRLDPANRRVQPIFKPDWSPTLLKSCMYLGHFLIVSRDLFRTVGGFNTRFDGAQDHDLALRISEQSVDVRHVPQILYHWRMHEESTSASAVKPYAQAAGHKAVEEALNRLGQSAAVELDHVPHTYKVRRRVSADARLTVVICTRTQRLAERSIRSFQSTVQGLTHEFVVVQHEDSGPNPEMRRALAALGADVLSYAGEFNFALMNNVGAQRATSPNLLFLNDDVYATGGGWCEAIVAELERPEVGVTGAVLRYPSGAIQHAGIVLGMGDGVGHAGRFQFASDLWPWLTTTREVSAVTGACLGIRTEIFERLGGFDAVFPNNYNDVDLCLRAGSGGLSVICVSNKELVHEECATRAGITHLRERELFYARWYRKLLQPDPFYSSSLGPNEQISLNPRSAASFFLPE